MKRIIAKLCIGIVIFLSLPSLSNAQWVQTTNFSAGLNEPYIVSALAVDSTGILAGIIGGGLSPHSVVFRSTDNGQTWTGILSFLVSNIVSCLAVNESNIYVYNGGLFLSTDNGANWTEIDNGVTLYSDFISSNGGRCQVNCIETYGAKLFAGTTCGAFTSTDSGKYWDPIDSGLPIHQAIIPCPSSGCPPIFVPPIVFCFAVDGFNLYAGTNFGVFRYSDSALSWIAIDSGLTDAVINSMVIDGSNLLAGTNSGVFMLENNGTYWTSEDSGLPPRTSVLSLIVADKNLYAGTYSSGVFFSTNSGKSWTAANSGLPLNVSVTALAVSGTNLFAGTNSNGIWRMPLSEASVHQLKSASGLHSLRLHSAVNRIDQNMTIEFSLPQGDRVALNIYNLSGKRTTTLVNDYLDAGMHSLSWDTRNLASGCYIVRMQTSTFVEGQKIEFIR